MLEMFIWSIITDSINFIILLFAQILDQQEHQLQSVWAM